MAASRLLEVCLLCLLLLLRLLLLTPLEGHLGLLLRRDLGQARELLLRASLKAPHSARPLCEPLSAPAAAAAGLGCHFVHDSDDLHAR